MFELKFNMSPKIGASEVTLATLVHYQVKSLLPHWSITKCSDSCHIGLLPSEVTLATLVHYQVK